MPSKRWLQKSRRAATPVGRAASKRHSSSKALAGRPAPRRGTHQQPARRHQRQLAARSRASEAAPRDRASRRAGRSTDSERERDDAHTPSSAGDAIDALTAFAHRSHNRAKMTVKRRSHGRNKKGRGHVNRVRCASTGKAIPKDKAIKRFIVRNIVDASSMRDIRDASAFETYALPKIYIKQYYCIEAAVHQRIVRSRSRTDRRNRDPPPRFRR